VAVDEMEFSEFFGSQYGVPVLAGPAVDRRPRRGRGAGPGGVGTHRNAGAPLTTGAAKGC